MNDKSLSFLSVGLSGVGLRFCENSKPLAQALVTVSKNSTRERVSEISPAQAWRPDVIQEGMSIQTFSTASRKSLESGAS